MASRRPRIVIKPNIKPTGNKAAATQPKAKSSQASVSETAVTAAQKASDSTNYQPEPSPLPVPSTKPGIDQDLGSNKKDSLDSSGIGISVKGNKDAGSAQGIETLNNDVSLRQSSQRPNVPESKKGKDTAQVTEPKTTASKAQEPPANEKVHGSKEHSQPSASQITHTHVVAPKSDEGVSSVPELSDLPCVVNTVPDESEPGGSKSQDGQTAQSNLVDVNGDGQPAPQVADSGGQENVQPDDVPEKPKRPRGREKKERAEPLPPCDRSPDRQKMKMGDLLSWNPSQNFLPKKKKKKISETATTEASPEPSESSVAVDDDVSNDSASLPAPQVMIGSDGNIVLNTESLMVGAPKNDGPKEIIEEDDEDRYLNTNSYRQTPRTKLWTKKEDENFYMALSMCGTDFSLMCELWPKRSRKELKNKFRREEKRHRGLIDKALANRQRYDPAPFKKMAAEEATRKKEIAKAQADKKKNKQDAADRKTKATKKIKTEKKARKTKKDKVESEDEEDDWGTDYDDVDDEENLVAGELDGSGAAPPAKKRKKAKTASVHEQELSHPKKPDAVTPETGPIDAPLRQSSENAPSSSSTQADSAMASKLPAQPDSSFSRFQAIPGSMPIQIDMAGMNKPLHGVLLPAHILPQVAPHLGIPQTGTPGQVLLVQEESSAGNLVHVYMVPDTGSESVASSLPPGGQQNSAGLSSGGSLTLQSLPMPSSHPSSSSHNTMPLSTQSATPLSAQGATQFAAQGTTQSVAQGATPLSAQGTTQLAAQGTTPLSDQGTTQLAAQGTTTLSAQGTTPLSAQGTTQVAAQGATQLAAQGPNQLVAHGTTPLSAEDTTPLAAQGTTQLAAQGTTPLAAQGTTPLAVQETTPLAVQGTTPLAVQGAPPLAAQGTTSLVAQGTTPLAAQSTTALSAQGTTPLSAESMTSLSAQGTTPLAAQVATPLAAQGTTSLAAQGTTPLSAQGATPLSIQITPGLLPPFPSQNVPPSNGNDRHPDTVQSAS